MPRFHPRKSAFTKPVIRRNRPAPPSAQPCKHGEHGYCQSCDDEIFAEWDKTQSSRRECPHGVVGPCNDCDVESDRQYDIRRESR